MAYFFLLLTLMVVGCSKDDPESPTQPAGNCVRIVAPADSLVLHITDHHLGSVGWGVDTTVYAQVEANLPGGVSNVRSVIRVSTAANYHDDEYLSFSPEGSTFLVPILGHDPRDTDMGMWMFYYDSVRITYYIQAVAGNGTVWTSQSQTLTAFPIR